MLLTAIVLFKEEEKNEIPVPNIPVMMSSPASLKEDLNRMRRMLINFIEEDCCCKGSYKTFIQKITPEGINEIDNFIIYLE